METHCFQLFLNMVRQKKALVCAIVFILRLMSCWFKDSSESLNVFPINPLGQNEYEAVNPERNACIMVILVFCEDFTPNKALCIRLNTIFSFLTESILDSLILSEQSEIKSHLYDVDDVIGQPENRKGADDHQDEAAALSLALELGALQAADDGGVTRVDEGERHQAAHDGLKQVLEDLVTHTAEVVRDTKAQSDVVWQRLLQITVRKGRKRQMKGESGSKCTDQSSR